MNTIISDNPFSEEETSTLATLAGMVIPASAKYGVPGADDEAILKEIIGTARRHADVITEGLNFINAEARKHKTSFSSLSEDTRKDIVEGVPQAFIRDLVTIAVQGYYKDPRIMESLGMEPRPPFPEGFEVEDGDWSMLDPVRDRGRIWREPPGR